MAARQKRVGCAVCDNFESQAWRKTLCKNCFHTLSEHNAGNRFSAAIQQNHEDKQVSSDDGSFYDNVRDSKDATKSSAVIPLCSDLQLEEEADLIETQNIVGGVRLDRKSAILASPKSALHKSGIVSSIVKSKQRDLSTKKYNGNGHKQEHSASRSTYTEYKTSNPCHLQGGSTKEKSLSFPPSKNSPTNQYNREDSNTSLPSSVLDTKLIPQMSTERDLTKNATKTTVLKRPESSLKLRRYSNSGSGAGLESRQEKIETFTKSKYGTSTAASKMPSTNTTLHKFPKNGKAIYSKHVSPKSSPKLRRNLSVCETKDINIQLAGVTSDKDKLDVKCNELSKTNQSLSETVDKLNKKISDLETENKELKTNCKAYDNLVINLSEMHQKHATLESTLAAKEDEKNRYEKTLEELQSLINKLTDENADLQLEVREKKQEIEEMYDQFRMSEVNEFRDLQKELEMTAKNCRLLQFKLRKSERKSSRAEVDRQQYEFKVRELQNLFDDEDAKGYINCLENELSKAKSETVHVQDELDIVEEKRLRAEEESKKLQEILDTTDKKQFRMEMEIDKLRDQIEDLRHKLREGTDNSDDEASQRRIFDANHLWRM